MVSKSSFALSLHGWSIEKEGVCVCAFVFAVKRGHWSEFYIQTVDTLKVHRAVQMVTNSVCIHLSMCYNIQCSLIFQGPRFTAIASLCVCMCGPGVRHFLCCLVQR